MTSKRIEMLAKIIEEAKLYKLAQDADVQGEVDEATADKMAEEILNQLVQDELTKLLG